MRRLVMAVLALGLLATGCSNPDYDPDLCDFYQSLSAGYDSHQGYTPIDIQNSIDKYCER